MRRKKKASFLAAICCLTLTLGTPVYAQEAETAVGDVQIVDENMEVIEAADAEAVADTEKVDVEAVTKKTVHFGQGYNTL